MGVELQYQSKLIDKVSDVREFEQRMIENLAAARTYEKGETQYALFEVIELPAIDQFAKVAAVQTINATGMLDITNEPWDEYLQILDSYKANMTDRLRLFISIGFEGIYRRSSKKQYELLTLHIDGNCKIFKFGAAGAEYENHIKVYADIFRKLDLPLKIDSNEYGYFIQPTQIDVGQSSSKLRYDPDKASCDLSHLSNSEVVLKVKAFLDCFATSKRFCYNWAIRPSKHASDDESVMKMTKSQKEEQAYEMMRVSNLPAIGYELDIEYKINEIAAIGGLKGMCGKRDIVFTDLCQFDLKNGDYGTISVITSCDGFRLNLTLHDPDSFELISPYLKYDFIETEDSKNQ
jgi:hypothetical protein